MYENINPQDENLEGAEGSEALEEQALEEAAHEPGAKIEATQTFEQAEAVEMELVTAVDGVERHGHETVPAEEISEGSGSEDGESGDQATPINLPGPEMLSVEEQENLANQPAQAEGGNAATPIVIPDIQRENDVAMEFDPIPEPPPEGQVARDPRGDGGLVAEMPEPGGDPPGPNRVGEVPDPIPEPEPEERRGYSSESGGDEGGEVTPINLPETPEDDNSATPINIP